MSEVKITKDNEMILGTVMGELALGIIATLKRLRRQLRALVTQDLLFFPYCGISDVVDRWIQKSGIDKCLPEQ